MSVTDRMTVEEFMSKCDIFYEGYRDLEKKIDPDPAVVVAVLATELASLICSQDDIDKSFQEFLNIFCRSIQVYKKEKESEDQRATSNNISSDIK